MGQSRLNPGRKLICGMEHRAFAKFANPLGFAINWFVIRFIGTGLCLFIGMLRTIVQIHA